MSIVLFAFRCASILTDAANFTATISLMVVKNPVFVLSPATKFEDLTSSIAQIEKAFDDMLQILMESTEIPYDSMLYNDPQGSNGTISIFISKKKRFSTSIEIEKIVAVMKTFNKTNGRISRRPFSHPFFASLISFVCSPIQYAITKFKTGKWSGTEAGAAFADKDFFLWPSFHFENLTDSCGEPIEGVYIGRGSWPSDRPELVRLPKQTPRPSQTPESRPTNSAASEK